MSNKSKRTRRHWAKAYRSLNPRSAFQRNMRHAKANTQQAWSGLEALESRVLFSANFLDGLPVVDYSLVVEEGPQAADVVDTGSNPSGAVTLENTFSLHSNPTANHTIYLDFDGHVTVNTQWNTWSGVDTIVTPAYDIDGNTSFFSDVELTRIGNIFERVAEDFAPFDVNVTTELPSIDDLLKSGSGDTRWGGRMVIGGSSTDWTGQSAGGFAYINSFNWSYDMPGFVFEAQLGNGHEKYTAEAISHEAGHMLGLNHDGSSSTEYYAGHGSGETGWASIMGVGYYKNLTQWSRGEYAGANNTQDDLSIITSQNGFGYRADDHGSTIGTASNLTLSGSSLSGSGIIERNTDADVFAFSTDSGTINLNISPFQRGPNLDILAQLYDASDNLITSSNPTGSLEANLSADVSAGTYFLKITGAGQGDPASTGYSDYGSLGQYTISGQVVEPPPSFSVSDVTVNEGDGTATFTVSLSQAVSQAVTVDVATLDGTALQTGDYQAVSQTLTFNAGQTSQSVVVSIVDDAVTESNETFTLQLSNATGGASIFDNQGVGTIVDNDTVVYVNISDVTLNEGNPKKGKNAGPRTTQATFTITLSEASNDTVTVQYTTQDGTATATDGAIDNEFDDYFAESGTVTFAAGQTTQTITIGVIGDGLTESNETFTVNLANATNATIADGQATGTILNDDSSGGGGGGGNGRGGKKNRNTTQSDQTQALSDAKSSLSTWASTQLRRDSAPSLSRASFKTTVKSSNWRLTSILDSSDDTSDSDSEPVYPWQHVSEGFQLQSYDG